jgi:hypothetical protein
VEGNPSDAELAAALARRLKAIREPAMRRVVLAEQLVGMEPARAVGALSALVAGAVHAGDAAHALAVETLSDALSEPDAVPYATRVALYREAKRGGRDDIGRLLFDGSPSSSAPGASEPERALEPERAVTPRGRALTLGERKALARTHRRALLQHVLRDPHPDVIAIALGNPHITESDVVRIAARRPAVSAALARIAADARWRARYAVKRALVKNPHTPQHVAIRLATTLRAADLRAVAADANLPAAVRDQARQLLAHRQPKSK